MDQPTDPRDIEALKAHFRQAAITHRLLEQADQAGAFPKGVPLPRMAPPVQCDANAAAADRGASTRWQRL
jgi:hypothetical protein